MRKIEIVPVPSQEVYILANLDRWEVLESGVIATFGSGDEEEYYTDGPTIEPPDGS